MNIQKVFEKAAINLQKAFRKIGRLFYTQSIKSGIFFALFRTT
nr:MAG TPA: hypothetical protein [Caudoviricetes sp.]